MKKTIYTLCAGVFALLTVIGCSKSDDNDSKKNKDKNDIEVREYSYPNGFFEEGFTADKITSSE